MPGAMNRPYTLWPITFTGAQSATGTLLYPPIAGPLKPPRGAWYRWFPFPDWSYSTVTQQYVSLQNASCAAASA